MKNKVGFLSVIAITVIFAFSFASCSQKEETEIGTGIIVANSDQWKEAIDTIMSGGDDNTHTINITEDFSIQGTSVNTFGSLTGVTITITGDKAISLAEGSIGSLLRIGSGQTVILQDVHLQGHSSNKYPLVSIAGKAFIMRGCASVSGNARRGVYISEGTFTMKDNASVHGNTVTSTGGGGVYVGGGTFIIQDDASVHSNTAAFTVGRNNTIIGGEGGGVYIAYNGTVVMEGGSVYGNTAISGGGMYIIGNYNNYNLIGTLRMIGGSVYGNSVESSGGGVYIAYRGYSVMEGGSVYGNTAKINGGGVFVAGNGSYSMEGGMIYGRDAEEGYKNTAERGAAVYDDNQNTSNKPLDNTVR
jgi:hypothetical protein